MNLPPDHICIDCICNKNGICTYDLDLDYEFCVNTCQQYKECLRLRTGRQPMELCTWVENDHIGIYQTACGNSFQFIDGTPESNRMKFCPYCGNLIRQKDGKPWPPYAKITSNTSTASCSLFLYYIVMEWSERSTLKNHGILLLVSSPYLQLPCLSG